VALSIQATLVVLWLARRADSFATAMTAVSAVFLAIGLGFTWVARRRGKRFLERNGAAPGPDAPDQG
jgi:hypothetical protein